MDLAAQVTKDEWAANEVDIAASINRAPYYVECLKSAERAFNCLMNDSHSGMSISITKSILNRLIDRKPLTPIEDTPDVWRDSNIYHADYHVYQCKRMSSLFKYVYEDGRVEIHDNNRFLCTEINNPYVPLSFSIVPEILREKYPMTMPYMPDNESYHVTISTNLYDDNGRSDFDTFSIIKVTRPDGAVDLINRYFKYNGDTWIEIEKDEYLTRISDNNN